MVGIPLFSSRYAASKGRGKYDLFIYNDIALLKASNRFER